MFENFGRYKDISFNHISKGKDVLVVCNGFLSINTFNLLRDLGKDNKIGMLDITQFLPLEWSKLKR